MPVRPSTTTRPPVIYSQPWSPVPSTTATAPELRTQKRSPATPLMKALPRGGAVEGHVADDHIVLAGIERAVLRGIDDQLAAGEALAQVIVGVALQLQGQSLGDEGAEGLAAAAVAVDDIGVVRQGVCRGAG